MSRKGQHTMGKRQRDQKKAEKVAHKQARRMERKDGETVPVNLADGPPQPVATVPPA